MQLAKILILSLNTMIPLKISLKKLFIQNFVPSYIHNYVFIYLDFSQKNSIFLV